MVKEKPYKYIIYGKAFSFISSLIQNQRSYTKVKSDEYDKRGKGFSQSAYFN